MKKIIGTCQFKILAEPLKLEIFLILSPKKIKEVDTLHLPVSPGTKYGI